MVRYTLCQNKVKHIPWLNGLQIPYGRIRDRIFLIKQKHQSIWKSFVQKIILSLYKSCPDSNGYLSFRWSVVCGLNTGQCIGTSDPMLGFLQEDTLWLILFCLREKKLESQWVIFFTCVAFEWLCTSEKLVGTTLWTFVYACTDIIPWHYWCIAVLNRINSKERFWNNS